MSEEIHRRLDRFVDVQREVENILQTLVLNDSTIIDALAQMLAAIQQMTSRNESVQLRFEQALSRLTTEVGALARTVANGRGASAGSLQPIVGLADGFASQNPEVGLMQHLYSCLDPGIVVDIGAHVGDVAERLLRVGYRVYAFEPYAPSFERLRQRLGDNPLFSARAIAIGAADAESILHVAGRSPGSEEPDPSLYNSLIDHPLHRAVRFETTQPVAVRSLASLALRGDIPLRGNILKIDAEGMELDIIAGMGQCEFDLVLAEFWDAEHPLGRAGHGWLAPIVEAMKSRGYHRHLVIYRLDESGTLSFYANRPDMVAKSWGNAAFFRDFTLFGRALRWCETVLPPTIQP
jgi:FkbM family methyltransferase